MAINVLKVWLFTYICINFHNLYFIDFDIKGRCIWGFVLNGDFGQLKDYPIVVFPL